MHVCVTGAEKSHDPASAHAAVAYVIRGMASAPYDTNDAEAYTRVRATLERKGSPIGPLDTQIAAQAVARGLILVTANGREFKRVPGLKVGDWT